MKILSFVLFIFPVFSMANPYDSATPEQVKNFKPVALPLKPGQRFSISQGAFGRDSHYEKGNEYSWDFAVPFGTSVAAIESGTVLEIWRPKGGGGCSPNFSNSAHNIKIEHSDGTVAQYVHIKTQLKVGDKVSLGQTVGVTAKNGWICRPHLHFGVYKSKKHLYNSKKRETLPLRFYQINGGLLKPKSKHRVPRPTTK